MNPESDLEKVWEHLKLLSRKGVVSGALEEFWLPKKTLSSVSLMKALFTEEVLDRVQRELRRKSDVRLELTDIAASLRRLLSGGEVEQTKKMNDTE